MIGILDYGMSNLGSVSKACRFLGLASSLINRPEDLDGCDAILLPGQGAFKDCMEHLDEHGFREPVCEWITEGRPYLGLCLGLQILCAESEEAPGVKGLGVLPGRVRKFQLGADFKVPQMGWNQVRQEQSQCPLFQDVADNAYFYFVHSYYVETPETESIAGTTDYGNRYTSMVCRDKLMAVQFHPEKSQKDGLQLLRNFGSWVDQQQVAR